MKAAGERIKALLIASQFFLFLRCSLSLNLEFIDFAKSSWPTSSRDPFVFVFLVLGL